MKYLPILLMLMGCAGEGFSSASGQSSDAAAAEDPSTSPEGSIPFQSGNPPPDSSDPNPDPADGGSGGSSSLPGPADGGGPVEPTGPEDGVGGQNVDSGSGGSDDNPSDPLVTPAVLEMEGLTLTNEVSCGANLDENNRLSDRTNHLTVNTNITDVPEEWKTRGPLEGCVSLENEVCVPGYNMAGVTGECKTYVGGIIICGFVFQFEADGSLPEHIRQNGLQFNLKGREKDILFSVTFAPFNTSCGFILRGENRSISFTLTHYQ